MRSRRWSSKWDSYLLFAIVTICIIIVGGTALLVSILPPPGTPSPQIFECEVVIVGAGPGGLTMAKRLAPIYGDRLCLFDDRETVAGKVESFRYTQSSDERPVWTPVHGEQLRGGDAIMRCMAQEVGTIMVVRVTIGAHNGFFALGINATGYQCFGKTTPTGPATCPGGTGQQQFNSILAPNGDTGVSPYGAFDIPVCINETWQECSYRDESAAILFAPENVATITNDETYREYYTRILGENAAQYYSDTYGFSYSDGLSARYMIDYITYDDAYPFGAIHVPHGGPRVGIWDRVAKLITGNGSRIMLNTRVQSISRDSATNGYRLVTASGDLINAQRVVIAIPPNQLEQMSGSVVSELVETDFVTFSQPTHACTWNAFFRTRWWKEHAVCNTGFCATGDRAFVNLSAQGRENVQWTFQDFTDGAGSDLLFVQFVPTPERIEGNLLRYFFEEGACETLDGIFTESGLAGVKTELMRRTRLKIGPAINGRIPEPVESYYSSERFAYSGVKVGSPLRAEQWFAWGTEPLPGEKICFATEGVNMLDSGWQEGASVVAHNCLRGPVFNDVISAETVNAAETCVAYSAATTDSVVLDKGPDSGGDPCLLMVNEFVIRALAGYPDDPLSCRTPSVYPYPDLASFNLTIQPPLYDPIIPEPAVAAAQLASNIEKLTACHRPHCI